MCSNSSFLDILRACFFSHRFVPVELTVAGGRKSESYTTTSNPKPHRQDAHAVCRSMCVF